MSRWLPLHAIALGLFCSIASRIAVADATMASERGTAEVAEAVDAYNRGDIGFAYRVLKQEAEAGDSDAQVNLGYLYARGQAVLANQAEAFRLYSLSASQGNGEGMNALGYKYQYGTGIKPDITKAVHWYCMAVLRGNPRAMNNLALLLEDGKAIPANHAEARDLWLQSAYRAHVNAMFNLAISYLYSTTLPPDPEQGKIWLLRAANGGNLGAQQLARKIGFLGPFPPPFDSAAQMQLQPRDATPGHAAICGDLVS